MKENEEKVEGNIKRREKTVLKENLELVKMIIEIGVAVLSLFAISEIRIMTSNVSNIVGIIENNAVIYEKTLNKMENSEISIY